MKFSYNKTVLDVSRYFIPEIKKFLNTKKSRKNILAFVDVLDKTYEINVKLSKNKSYEFSHDIEAITDDEKINLKIILNEDKFPFEYNELIYDFKDTIRHELEHCTQLTNKNKSLPIIKGNKCLYDYMLQEHEISAFLHGFHTRAKTSKKSMNETICKWINNMEKFFNNNFEIFNISLIYIEEGKKLFPKAKWL